MKIKIHLFLTALLLLALGVICVITPNDGVAAIATIMGILILVSGFVSLLFGLQRQPLLPSLASTKLLAIFQMIIGVIFLLHGWIAAETLLVVFAIWVLLEGVSIMVASFDYKRAEYQYWWLMFVFGVLGISLAFVAICHPDTMVVALTRLIGLGIIAIAVVRLAAIPAVSRLQKRVKELQKIAERATETLQQEPTSQPSAEEADPQSADNELPLGQAD